jgi:hypothetical protein
MGVLRAITELWQQLRIIPIVAAPGKAAKWQLLRVRFQKAIAEGASTSQVTAISVLASIFLQAVIAASMEEVEIFLSPLTARSKIREVLRGLVATRQVHTLSLGHAPHFYVAGTLPEFAPSPTIYNSTLGSAYLTQLREEDSYHEPVAPVRAPEKKHEIEEPETASHGQASSSSSKPASSRPHFARSTNHARDRKPSAAPARRPSESRPSRPAAGSRNGASTRWNAPAKNGSHASNGHSSNGHGTPKASKPSATEHSAAPSRNGKKAAPAWKSRNGSHAAPAKTGTGRSSSMSRTTSARKEARPASRNGRKPALASGSGSKRFGLAGKGTKKHG